MNTVMDTERTKDNEKARLDMAVLCKRPDLNLVQEPQIQMMPTPGVPRSCTQQANEPSNTASHGMQSDPGIVAPSRPESCGERQTTSNSTQDAQGQGTSTATGHSSTSAPKLRYDGAKWFFICFKFYE
ncbi:hypothetical protein AHAS_Ahas03G0187400 [Arachis hypogaea]